MTEFLWVSEVYYHTSQRWVLLSLLKVNTPEKDELFAQVSSLEEQSQALTWLICFTLEPRKLM